jgi:hypothetical protein
MPAETEDTGAVRREIWSLLEQQMEALNSPEGLTDSQLMECYERQSRVQELRETIEAAGEPGTDVYSPVVDLPAQNTTVHRSQEVFPPFNVAA